MAWQPKGFVQQQMNNKPLQGLDDLSNSLFEPPYVYHPVKTEDPSYIKT